ncbi:MAG: M20 family metallopeptidase, partial [Myxococcota bacterium]
HRLEGLVVDAVGCYSPSLAEEPVMEVFEEALNEAGVPSWRQPVETGDGEDRQRANLLVQAGPEPTALLLVGHVDTIPLRHDEELKVRREGDLLYGLGAADMKAGCAAMVEAVSALKASKVPLKRGLKVALVVGEEELGDGSEAVAEVLDAPLTVIGEPTGLLPCTSHNGYLEYRLAAEGRRVHAALPEAGDNAIHTMLAWITDILRRAERLPPGREAAVSLREIRGGTGMFVTADHCEALLDVHLPPGVDHSLVAAMLQDARSGLSSGRSVQAYFDELFWAPGYATDPRDPRLDPLRRSFEAAELDWQPSTFRSHSDAPILHAAGTLPVVCGPGRLEVAHTRFEHVSMSEVRRAARLYSAMICAACT